MTRQRRRVLLPIVLENCCGGGGSSPTPPPDIPALWILRDEDDSIYRYDLDTDTLSSALDTWNSTGFAILGFKVDLDAQMAFIAQQAAGPGVYELKAATFNPGTGALGTFAAIAATAASDGSQLRLAFLDRPNERVYAWNQPDEEGLTQLWSYDYDGGNPVVHTAGNTGSGYDWFAGACTNIDYNRMYLIQPLSTLGNTPRQGYKPMGNAPGVGDVEISTHASGQGLRSALVDEAGGRMFAFSSTRIVRHFLDGSSFNEWANNATEQLDGNEFGAAIDIARDRLYVVNNDAGGDQNIEYADLDNVPADGPRNILVDGSAESWTDTGLNRTMLDTGYN